MNDADLVVCVNGQFLPREQAKISVFDRVVIYGDGVYDTLVESNGFIFKLDAHVERLFRSARAVAIDIGKSRDEINELIIRTIRMNNLRDAYIKIVVSRGVARTPLMGSNEEGDPTIIIFAVPPVSVVNEEKINKGAKLLSSTLKRAHPDSLDPRIKSVNYQPNMLIRREAKAGGADEGICYGYDGYVAEGGGENIWIVKNKILMTPGHGVLEGITREVVFEIAKRLGYATIACDINKYDLYQADEIFLCSTAGGIIPVTEVDHRTVSNGRPGGITKQLQIKYSEMCQAGEYGTPVY